MKYPFYILSLLFALASLSCQHLPSSSRSKPLYAKLYAKPDDTDIIKYDDETPHYLELNKRLPSALSVYTITGQCGGLPRVDVKTAPGFCLGQIDSGDGLSMPRTAVALASGDLLLADMGSWEPNVGKIFAYKKETNGTYTRRLFLNARDVKDVKKKKILDRPHQLTLSSDGWVYIGGATALGRFNPKAANPIDSIQVLIEDLPAEGLHPLKSFVFDDHRNVYINVGSATNVCQKSGDLGDRLNNCPEAEHATRGQALIRKYNLQNDGNYNPQYEIYSRGLRNSVGLMWDEKHQLLLEVENGRDAINKNAPELDTKTLPHEEINVLKPGKHYGWPYCYDNNLNNPEWKKINCAAYEKPYLLLPAHSAPLSMMLYQGSQFPAWYKNRILMSFHGYESFGHRIVTFLRDDAGLPTGVPLSIVYGWDTKGPQKMGSPVGLATLADGSVLIVEDKSRKVLRLFYDARAGDGKPVREIDSNPNEDPNEEIDKERRRESLEERLREPEPPLFTLIQHRLIDKHCASCHTGTDARGLELRWYDDIGNEARIKQHQKGMDIYRRISGDLTLSQMPPDGFNSPEEQKELAELFKKWLDGQ